MSKRKTPSRKALKRKKLQREKKLLALRKAGQATRKLTEEQLNIAYTEVKTKQKRSNKRKSTKHQRISKKKNLLWEKYQIDATLYGDTKIDKITFAEIESGDFSRHKWLDFFDYDKILHTKSERIMIAFRDFTGEKNFKKLVEEMQKESNEKLIEIIKVNKGDISNLFADEESGSGGKAGDAIVRTGNIEELKVYNIADIITPNKRAKRKKWLREKSYVGFQVVKFKGKNSFEEITAHNLLAIVASIITNTTMKARIEFYTEFYDVCAKELPEMLKILPKP